MPGVKAFYARLREVSSGKFLREAGICLVKLLVVRSSIFKDFSLEKSDKVSDMEFPMRFEGLKVVAIRERQWKNPIKVIETRPE
jgi:hypothetical protein